MIVTINPVNPVNPVNFGRPASLHLSPETDADHAALAEINARFATCGFGMIVDPVDGKQTGQYRHLQLPIGRGGDVVVRLTPAGHQQEYTASVDGLPGCVSEGDSIRDALSNIGEAIDLYLEPQ